MDLITATTLLRLESEFFLKFNALLRNDFLK